MFDQALSSAGNALVLVLGALALPASQLNQLTLLQYIGLTSLGLSRALFSIPGMAVRTDGAAPAVSLRALLVIVPLGFLGSSVGVRAIGESSGADAVLLSAVLVLPAVQDLFRYRALSLGQTQRAALADGAWLILACVPLVVMPFSHASDATIVWALAAGASIAFLVPWRARDLPTAPALRAVLSLGKYEFAIRALSFGLNWTLLAVALWLSSDAAVGEYRLALAFVGPLVALNVAQTTEILRNASKNRDQWATSGLTKPAQARARLMILVAVPYTLVAATACIVLFGSDPATSLLMFLVILGGLARVTRTPQTAILRAIGYQRTYFRIETLVNISGLVAAIAAGLLSGNGTVVLVVFTVVSQILSWAVWPWVLRRASERFMTTETY